MTAPLPTNGHNNGTNSDNNNMQHQNEPNQQEQPPREDEPQPEETDRPELDDFVNEFHDGDKYTDVDSRVWV